MSSKHTHVSVLHGMQGLGNPYIQWELSRRIKTFATYSSQRFFQCTVMHRQVKPPRIPQLLHHQHLQAVQPEGGRECKPWYKLRLHSLPAKGRELEEIRELRVEAPCPFCSALIEHALALSHLYLYDREQNDLSCLFQVGSTAAFLSMQAVTFQFMLSVYSVLALWFMINLKELDHTLSRSSGRNSVDC